MNKDSITRQEALDPTRSFIVQAPAGSGKTELLTQRFLQLLCHTRKTPEEVVAVTFTRKAAGEMRERILSALTMAEQGEAPEKPHQKITWTLAKNVLERDEAYGWNIQSNPNRLRILTIDALAAGIAKQIPLHAKLSPQPKLIENPTPYYQQAVQQLIFSIADNTEQGGAITSLLMHLDNNAYQLESLLIHILKKREQWLPYILGHQENMEALKNQMELALQEIAAEKMQAVSQLIKNDIASELIPLAHYAGLYCQKHDPENPIAACHKIKLLPDTSTKSLAIWQGIATIFLTQKGEWRKRITKREGFPADAKEKNIKQQLKDLLNTLQENDLLRESLHGLLGCPPLHYDTDQWKTIKALITLLPMLAAQLHLIFQENGCSDFVEINLAAHRALGEAENPTDLALYLDHQITHLLVDEFQDTSLMQFKLIEKLLSGWETGDGRTLFLVGDPMQSIYRFRNAEVGLFIRTQEQGIANIALNTLRLEKNFRSTPRIVDWINDAFSRIFPKQSDIASGAIPYATAMAATPNNDDSNIKWHPLFNDDGSEEAQRILDIIREKSQKHPNNTIAILVRSRNQLHDITASLHEENIPFKAIDIEPLSERMEIQDVHTLTRILLHRADRIAWLALLRAPYCGLTLQDLHIITQASQNSTLWQGLKKYKELDALSPDAKIRLNHLTPHLHSAIENYGCQTFSQSIKNLWLGIGGPATLENTTQLNNVTAYFRLIESVEQSEANLSLSRIEEKLFQLYAEPNADASDHLQIMTIHKAKGLEFDHVILPNLNRKTPHDPSQLLMWLERPNLSGGSNLMLAPIKSAANSQDPMYTYLRHLEKSKGDNETTRLLYVAATRAKQSLDFIASVYIDNEKEEPIASARKGSFLELLWPMAKPIFLSKEETFSNTENLFSENNDAEIYEPRLLKRLSKNWMLSTTFPTNPHPHKLENSTLASWPSDTKPKIIGTVIHECLQQISEDPRVWTKEIIEKQKTQWETRLAQLGMKTTEQKQSIDTITNAITKTIEDKRGSWILSNKHQDAHSEYALTGVIDETIVNNIIDRCFIDSENCRWIIDYKTSAASDETLDKFLLQQKEKYQAQLEHYAQLMQHMEDRTIKLGLYFPLCSAWTEWSFYRTK